jgi:glucose-6-phosphate isomerase
MSFFNLKAFQQLKKLSEHPVDLTQDLTSDRIEKYILKGDGFTFFYGAERVTDKVLDSLYALADESHALDKMRQMQTGVVINQINGYPSEDRAVLHTAMRDQFGSPISGKAADLEAQQLMKLEHFLNKIEGKFRYCIQVGIGGSDLGPRALCMALKAFHKSNREIHFVSNVDPDDVYGTLLQIDLKQTLVVVVSKSGSTLETLTNETLIRAEFKKKGLDPKDHFVAVTGKKSPMDNPSHYLASFHMWDFVGGRYSATSMVGGVVLGFALGFQGFKEILRGAHAMDLHALNAPLRENLPLLSALLGIWNRNFLHLPTVAIIPYSQALLRFPAHLQQLDMESNGKGIDKEGTYCLFATGPIIWGEPGTNGQHSFYQLIHQGTDIVPLEFIGFKKSQYEKDLEVEHTTSQEKLLSNLFAQSIALAKGQKSDNPNQEFLGNRPNRILLADRLDPYTLGKLLSFYEHKVAFQGFIWNINSFDQEGVQLGKKLANQTLALFKGKRTKEKVSAFPLAESYLRNL